MMEMKKILFIACLSFVMQAYADTRVNIVGLFSNKALVMINGSGPHILKAGQTKSGVKLLSSNSSSATLIIEGKRQVLSMGQAVAIGSGLSSTDGVNSPVSLYADKAGHFFGNATINGATLKYVIDTGATNVTMNSRDAKAARIDYANGRQVNMSTANGVITARNVTLNTLKIGTIVLNNIEVTIVEGDSPPFVLLGMSAQNKLNIKRENSIMTLTKKY